MKAWIASDPEVRIAQVILLMLVLKLAAGWFMPAVVLWLAFRAFRWVGRKLCFSSVSSYEDGDFCADRNWPRVGVSLWWEEVTA